MDTLAAPHRSFIVEKVRQYYEKYDRPILLSDLGTLFAHEHGRFSSSYDTPFRERIQRDLSDELAVVSHPEILQKIYVTPIDKVDEATQFVASDPAQFATDRVLSQEPVSVELPKLQRSILFAFQVTPSVGEDIYVTSAAPFRFVRRSEPPAADEKLLLVEPEFSLRLPTLKQLDELSPDEKLQLSQKIDQWAQKHLIDIRRFYFRQAATRILQPARRANLTALERLINSQPEEIRKKVLIPADIIRYLLAIS